MTLLPGKYPCNFEGEIQCSIEWDSDNARHDETKSVATNTVVNEPSEFLFIRLKKRQKIKPINLGVDAREGESLIENIVNDAIHEILESDDFDNLLDDANQAKAGLFAPAITNQAAPSTELKAMEEEIKGGSEVDIREEESSDDRVYLNRQGAAYEENIKKIYGINESELNRKRMFLQEPFVDLMEFMLEDTLFNLMEEATYEEFDLGQPPKIYIRKDQ